MSAIKTQKSVLVCYSKALKSISYSGLVSDLTSAESNTRDDIYLNLRI